MLSPVEECRVFALCVLVYVERGVRGGACGKWMGK